MGGPGEVLGCLNTGHLVRAGSGRQEQITTGLLREKAACKGGGGGALVQPRHCRKPTPSQMALGPHSYNVISPSLMPETFLWNAQRTNSAHLCLSVYLPARLCCDLGCPDQFPSRIAEDNVPFW